MTTDKKSTQDDTVQDNVYDLSRKILLAAVGAAAIAQDEISGFINQLAERGELAEKDAKGLVKEIIERREKIIQERRAEFQHPRPKSASQTDVDDLKAKIADLSRQIEELKKS